MARLSYTNVVLKSSSTRESDLSSYFHDSDLCDLDLDSNLYDYDSYPLDLYLELSTKIAVIFSPFIMEISCIICVFRVFVFAAFGLMQSCDT